MLVAGSGLLMHTYLLSRRYKKQLLLASDMSASIRDVSSLDTLLILGGEANTLARSKKAAHVLDSLRIKQPDTYKNLRVVASGLGNNNSLTPQSQQIANYLSEQGINKDVLVETRSQDTHANMVFSYPFLKNAQTVGLVTDAYHMDRSRFLFEHVYDKKPLALPTNNQGTAKQQLIEQAITYSLKTDFLLFNAIKGNIESHRKFFFQRNPFHSPNPRSSTYKTALQTYQLLF